MQLFIQIMILLLTGEFTGSDAWGGIQEDEDIVRYLYALHEALFPTWDA